MRGDEFLKFGGEVVGWKVGARVGEFGTLEIRETGRARKNVTNILFSDLVCRRYQTSDPR